MIAVEIRIPVRLFGWEWTRKLKRSFPEKLSELSPQQLGQFCKAVIASQNIYEAKLAVLVSVCRLPLLLLKALDIAQVAQLTLMVNPLFEENDLTVNKLPEICFYHRWKTHRWRGPADSLANLTIKEFAVADSYFLAFMESKDDSLLDFLIACLYRPQDSKKNPNRPDYDGDMREVFNEHILEKRANIVRTLSKVDKQVILYFYMASRKLLHVDYPNIFDEDGQDGQQHKQPSDWLDMIRTLPNEKFGTIQQAEKENMHAVFTVVDRMMMDAKKNKTPKDHEA